MVRRGRPLMRAAMVGGVAYHAGKKHHAAAAPRPQPRRWSLRRGDRSAQGARQLKEAGVLTQEEFDAQKAQLLRS